MHHDTSPPPTLEVHDSSTGEVPPSSVDLHVVLRGDRFFSGRAAFEKAEELRKLAESMSKLGVPTSALSLEGASIDVSTGLFSKSSSVTYRVRVRLEDLELLGGVLEVVSESKKATLSDLAWSYDGGSEEEQALLQRAGARAVAKAKRLAAAVGAELGALRMVREERHDEHVVPAPGGFGPPTAMASRMSASMPSVSSELSGLELAPRKRVTVHVHLSYALAGG
jgi:hypothetical protein